MKQKDLPKATKSGFYIEEESPDDVALYQHGKKICLLSLPEGEIEWEGQ